MKDGGVDDVHSASFLLQVKKQQSGTTALWD